MPIFARSEGHRRPPLRGQTRQGRQGQRRHGLPRHRRPHPHADLRHHRRRDPEQRRARLRAPPHPPPRRALRPPDARAPSPASSPTSCPIVVERWAGVPGTQEEPARVAEIIREEEESFGKTLDRGIKIFDEIAAARQEGTSEDLRRRRLQALRHLRLPHRPHRPHGRGTRPEGRHRRLRGRAQEGRRTSPAPAARPRPTKPRLSLTARPSPVSGTCTSKPTDDAPQVRWPRTSRPASRRSGTGRTSTSTPRSEVAEQADDRHHPRPHQLLRRMGGQEATRARCVSSRPLHAGDHDGGEFIVEHASSLWRVRPAHRPHRAGRDRVGDTVQIKSTCPP
jgi:hypothetical protein